MRAVWGVVRAGRRGSWGQIYAGVMDEVTYITRNYPDVRAASHATRGEQGGKGGREERESLLVPFPLILYLSPRPRPIPTPLLSPLYLSLLILLIHLLFLSLSFSLWCRVTF